MEQKHKPALITFLIIASLVIILFLIMIYPYLITILVGGILATLLKPIYNFLLTRKFSSKISATLSTLFVSLVIAGPLGSFTILAVDQGMTVGKKLADTEAISYSSVAQTLEKVPMMEIMMGDKTIIETKIREGVKTGGIFLTTGILQILRNTPRFLMQLALIIITCFFFLMDGKPLVEWLFAKLPLFRDVKDKISTSFQNIAISVVWATLAAATSQAVVICFGFLVLNIPAAFFAAGATFLFAWIPVIGSTPVWLSGALYLYYHGTITQVVLIIVIGLIAGVIDNLVRPYVLRGRGDMHPLLSLVAIFGGINIFGLFGVFIGPIVAAILVSVLEIWPLVGKRAGIEFSDH